MKEKELKQLIQSHTTEESGLDYSALSNDINTQFNVLLDKKMPDLDAEKTKWEESYSKSFFDDLGIDNINSRETLKSYLEERKDFDPQKFNELNSNVNRLNQELDVRKSNFNGDDDDMDYIIHKANTMISAEEGLSFSDAIKQIQESKPSYFGQQTITQHKVNPPKQSYAPSAAQELAKKYGVQLD